MLSDLQVEKSELFSGATPGGLMCVNPGILQQQNWHMHGTCLDDPILHAFPGEQGLQRPHSDAAVLD
jgi:hypothetical protein